MKLSLFGRWSMALFASLVLGLGMTACGGGTIGYMWVLGQEYNQIGGFKVDDYSGNLTEVPGAPFDSNGSMPVSIVVKSGSASGRGTGSSIAVFSVGGDGVLTFQQSYQSEGYVSQWAQMDSGGNYLYVLDKYSPGLNPQTGLYDAPNTDGNGSVTVFAADATSGRLTLVLNANVKKSSVNIPFFEVGPSPFMMKATAGCLYTVDGGNQTIFPYVIGIAGQLTPFTPGVIIPQETNLNITSINGAGSYIFLTDSNGDQILGFQSGGTCNLAPLNGGVTANDIHATNPVYSMLDTKNQYLYVLNGSTTSTNPTIPYSSISGFVINAANQELTEIDPGVTFTVGSGPVCMVEDPSSQYVYTSNHNDGTITGKAYASTTGELSQLKRGSTFPTVGKPGCLVISGSID